MNLVAVSIESIRIGAPLPFPLRNENGALLANRGFVVNSRSDLEAMRGRGMDFYVDVDESESYRKAFVGKLHELVRGERPLGQIAEARISAVDVSGRTSTPNELPDWLDLQEQASTLLRDHQPAQFVDRVTTLQNQLDRHTRRNPDGTLFALIQLSATELRMYSATHAMLVSVMCGLAARDVLNWPEEAQSLVCKAALTMNISMTELQDRLAVQMEAPSVAQRQQIDGHAVRSAELLVQRGVNLPDWLEAVRDHHEPQGGPLASKTLGKRMARLIQRADMFAARLAPRAARVPTSPAAAMQATYFDENRQIDEAGAALIKAAGIYQPGSFVRLATNEIAVVVRRGANTTTPRVAVLVNRDGIATTEHVVRDTGLRDHRIVSSVAHREVKVKLNLDRFLPLTVTPPSGRLG